MFLAGIWRTEEKFECSVIAACLLYFFLSALMWMLLEGYQLYQMLVEVFPASRRRLTFFVVGYGVPAVITGAAALYDPTGFELEITAGFAPTTSSSCSSSLRRPSFS